jgi:hypothetical protein
LLFPNGSSQHNPADGGSITREDVRVAQAQHKDLATQIAGFFTLRQGPKPSIVVADASGARPAAPAEASRRLPPPIAPPPPRVSEPKVAALTPPPLPTPKLVAAPKLIERASRLTPRPSDADRSQLTTLVSFVAEAPPRLIAEPVQATRRKPQASSDNGRADIKPETGLRLALDPPASPRTQWTQVAALDPATFAGVQSPGAVLNDANRTGWSNGWVSAPAYDEEHPEELSYRPFPLAPLLTALD